MTVVKMPNIEFRAMPEDEEQRNNLLEQMEGILNKAKQEQRSLSIAEQNRFNDLKSKVGNIDRNKEQRDLDTLVNNSVSAKKSKALTTKEREEIRAFVEYVRTGRIEGRDLSSGQSGAIVPTTVETQIIAKVKELAPIFARMTHYNVTGNLSIPSYPWDAHTVAFVEDFQDIATSGGTFLTVDLVSHAFSSLALVGNNLINRTDVPVLDIIVEQIATAISNFISDQIINNTGARFSGTLQSVTQSVGYTAATGITALDLVNLQMQVPSQFQNEAVWLMHPDTFGAIRRLTDADGNLMMLNGSGSLSDGMSFSLLGKEVLLDENMPTTGRTVYYGDFSGMVCNQNSNFTTRILQERYIDINATGVITGMDLDITVAQPRALAVLVGA